MMLVFMLAILVTINGRISSPLAFVDVDAIHLIVDGPLFGFDCAEEGKTHTSCKDT